MTESIILSKLEEHFGRVMTLTQAFEVVKRVQLTQEVLDNEGNRGKYSAEELVRDIGTALMMEE